MSGPVQFVLGACWVRFMKKFLQGILDDLRDGRSFRRSPDFCSLVQAIVKLESRTHTGKHIDEAEVRQLAADFGAGKAGKALSVVDNIQKMVFEI